MPRARKWKPLVIVWAMGCILLLSGCNQAHDENPSGTKYIGSDVLPVSKAGGQTVEIMSDIADVILVGTVVSRGSEYVESLVFEDIPEMYVKDNHVSKMQLTQFEVEIQDVLKGDVSSDRLFFGQNGAPDSDVGTTKVHKNCTYPMFLVEDEDKHIFYSVSFEDGLFEVLADGTVVSMSNEPALAKYDNVQFSELGADIEKALLD